MTNMKNTFNGVIVKTNEDVLVKLLGQPTIFDGAKSWNITCDRGRDYTLVSVGLNEYHLLGEGFMYDLACGKDLMVKLSFQVGRLYNLEMNGRNYIYTL